MIRNFTALSFSVLLAGCAQFQPASQGPFARTQKALPPPYGTSSAVNVPNKPLANQSPLGMASADPAPPPPDEPSLIPPKAGGVVHAGGVPASVDANAFPPFKRRPEPQPNALPSPFAPKGDNAPAPAQTFMQVKGVLATAQAAWKAVDTYEATLTRRELNPKGQVNSEVLIFQFRREPMSVFTRNIGGGGKGRETVYNPGKHGDKMYVMLGEGDSKLMKAGFIAPPISPDDSRVKEKARYSIRDSGFGRTISAFGAAVAKVEAGAAPADSLVYLGKVKRDEYSYPLVGVTHKLRRGDDPLMPAGGTRQYFFDPEKDSPSYGLPVLVIAADPGGKEVEYYLFAKVKSPADLTEADFNPARLGKK